MIEVSNQSRKKISGLMGKARSYAEVVAYLDACPQLAYNQEVVDRAKKLSELHGNITEQIDTIVVGGTNGKGTTMHFASKLLREEGVSAALLYSSHYLTYNERFVVDNEVVSNKDFTTIVTTVITTVEQAAMTVSAAEILFISGLLYAKERGARVALVEVYNAGRYDIASLCTPKIVALTRIAHDANSNIPHDLDQVAEEMVALTKSGSWIISAEQSKIRLQKMKKLVEARGGQWAMPIRKLSPLPYIYEQLYGRIASLGERIAQIYIEEVCQKFSPFLRGNLLATQRGQRGRPTLEAKRLAEQNPVKSMRDFWNDQFSLLHGRFEVLDKEKPMTVLDNADNIDAFENTFLGVRLLHYQRSFKNISLILGIAAELDKVEVAKSIRYLLKKVPGEVIFVPRGGSYSSHDPFDMADIVKSLNVPARAFDSFEKAFKAVTSDENEKESLVVIAGSEKLLTQYWEQKGYKKF